MTVQCCEAAVMLQLVTQLIKQPIIMFSFPQM